MNHSARVASARTRAQDGDLEVEITVVRTWTETWSPAPDAEDIPSDIRAALKAWLAEGDAAEAQP